MIATAESPDGEWCVGYQVEFLDGSTPMCCILGINTRELCEQAITRLDFGQAPYSGPRPAGVATLFACPLGKIRDR